MARGGAGKTVAVTPKVLGVPTVKVVLLALVMVGVRLTVSVKFCVALPPTPLLAVMRIGKLPLTVGVPLSAPVLLRLTPVGNAPVSVRIGAGKPVAVTIKE